MPGPTTESLNDDVKLLTQAIHAVETSLKEDTHKVAVSLAELRGEFVAYKWLISLTLALALSTLGGGIWWAGNLNAKVAGIDQRLDKLDGRLDRIEAGIAKAVSHATPKDGPAPR